MAGHNIAASSLHCTERELSLLNGSVKSCRFMSSGKSLMNRKGFLDTRFYYTRAFHNCIANNSLSVLLKFTLQTVIPLLKTKTKHTVVSIFSHILTAYRK